MWCQCIDDVLLLYLNNTMIQNVQKNGFLNFMLILFGEKLRMEFGISLAYPTALLQHQWVQTKEQRILTDSSQSLFNNFSAQKLLFLYDPLKVSCLTLLFFCENQSSFLPWALGFASLMLQEGEVEWVRACPQRWELRNGLSYSILGIVSSYCTVETT